MLQTCWLIRKKKLDDGVDRQTIQRISHAFTYATDSEKKPEPNVRIAVFTFVTL